MRGWPLSNPVGTIAGTGTASTLAEAAAFCFNRRHFASTDQRGNNIPAKDVFEVSLNPNGQNVPPSAAGLSKDVEEDPGTDALATASPISAGGATKVVQAATSSGPSTHERKNRKKRTRKSTDSGFDAKKMRVTPEIEETYNKLAFVTIDHFHVSYNHFRLALKPRGELCNEVMAIWIKLFDFHCREDGKIKTNVKKYAFLNVITGQLVADPENFMIRQHG
ncbi:hypothetical protein E2562_018200 [Oryza meyeriana var. granulata]|uniref:Uncharacterized protein n=1 Tax=Oryza meyeriana var. granulata TaxID=110450 RepID=A0A6G1C613_9ORYZ|nr:hypothetical protein E2562_018200 [Oryza meyeriana var. granulata]